jgi:hypothetical protein
MSTSLRSARPLLSRPWFAVLSLTVGMSTAAFAAYTVENPYAFTSPHPLPAPKTERFAAVPRAPETAVEAPHEVRIELDPMRIVGHANPRLVTTARTPDTCNPAWHAMNTGPANRAVRELCPTPAGEGVARPAAASHAAGPVAERLVTPPIAHHELMGLEPPSLATSLEDLEPGR